MAAPKPGRCFFGGGLQEEPKHARAFAAANEAESPRRRARPALPSRCLREHAGQSDPLPRKLQSSVKISRFESVHKTLTPLCRSFSSR